MRPNIGEPGVQGPRQLVALLVTDHSPAAGIVFGDGTTPTTGPTVSAFAKMKAWWEHAGPYRQPLMSLQGLRGVVRLAGLAFEL